LSTHYVRRHWDFFKGKFVPGDQIAMQIYAANQEQLSIDGIVFTKVQNGSKCYTQKFFVIDGLRHEALLGLDFLRKAKVEIDLANHVLRHRSNVKEVVYLDEPPQVAVGSVTDPRTQSTAFTRYDHEVPKWAMINMPVRLFPEPPPGQYEISSKHLLGRTKGSGDGLWCDGVVKVEYGKPTFLRGLNVGEATLHVRKGDALAALLPPIGVSSRDNLVFQELGEEIALAELPSWDSAPAPAATQSALWVSAIIAADPEAFVQAAKETPKEPRVASGELSGQELRDAQAQVVLDGVADFYPDLDESDMTEEQKRLFTAIVRSKLAAFTPDKEIPGCTDLEELVLNTGTHKPVAIPPRRIPYSQEQMVYEKIQSWLKHGIIRPSSCPWAAPVVVVMKNGKFRLAIDYRELNKRLSDDFLNYPLTLIDSCLDVGWVAVFHHSRHHGCLPPGQGRGVKQAQDCFCVQVGPVRVQPCSLRYQNATGPLVSDS